MLLRAPLTSKTKMIMLLIPTLLLTPLLSNVTVSAVVVTGQTDAGAEAGDLTQESVQGSQVRY